MTLAALSIILGAVFTIAYSFTPVYLVCTVIGNLMSWYYTAPPIRLAYNGFSEMATMIAIGSMIPDIGDFTMYVGLSPLFLAFTLPLLLYALMFIINVQIPDMESDRHSGKNTYIARHGRRSGFETGLAILALATVYFAVMSIAIADSVVNFKAITAISLLPLCAGVFSFIMRDCTMEHAIKLVRLNIGSFLTFIFITDAYLACLLICSG